MDREENTVSPAAPLLRVTNLLRLLSSNDRCLESLLEAAV
jgi:hypothetical protein